MKLSASPILHKVLINHINKLRRYRNPFRSKNIHVRRHDLPIVSVACELNGIKKANDNGSYDNYPIFLKQKFNQNCAPIGTRIRQNNGRYYTIGRCAEQRSARDIFNHIPVAQHNNANFKNLEFTEARRPRTMQIIKYCSNCKNIFR